MIFSSVNLDRFIRPSLPWGGLYVFLEEFQGVRSRLLARKDVLFVMTRQPTRPCPADAQENTLNGLIDPIRSGFCERPAPATYKASWGDGTAVIEIYRDHKTRYIYSSVGYFNQAAHELIYGEPSKKIDIPSCLVSMQCGHLSSPHKTLILVDQLQTSIEKFSDITASDARGFFCKIHGLQDAYSALTSNPPSVKAF